MPYVQSSVIGSPSRGVNCTIWQHRSRLVRPFEFPLDRTRDLPPAACESHLA
jgi:hypothetical protein